MSEAARTRAAPAGPGLETLAHLRAELDRHAAERRPAGPVRVSDRPRRVAVLGLAGVGGSGKVAADTAEGLAARGHTLTYLTGPDPAFLPSGARHVVVGAPRDPGGDEAAWVEALAHDLVRAMARERPELLLVNYVGGLLEAALRARGALGAAGPAPRLVAVMHGSDVTRWAPASTASAPAEAGARRLHDALVAADEVVAVSAWLAEEARARLGLERAVRVVDNGVDVGRFRPGRWSAAVRGRFAPPGTLLLGHVSNMRPIKRSTDAVETLAALKRHGVAARLLMVGEGPDMASARARADDLGLGDAVSFAGAVGADALPELVAAFDLMLITSESESFSLAAMEAMAAGVPVVATRCGGLERAMNRLAAVGGVPPVAVGVPEELARGVRRLWFDPPRYAAVALAGLRMAIEDYPRRRQLDSYADLVEAMGSGIP